jgi:mannose-6-phosphate isomerase-like protein (cupin superfamily)
MTDGILRPGEGLRFGDNASAYTSVFKLLTSQTEGQLCLEEESVPVGFVAPPHRHLTRLEFFYVLEGDLQFIVAEDTVNVGPGASVFVPKGARHAYSNVSDAPARQLALWAPGGFEAMYEDVAAAFPTRGSFDWEKLVEIWRRNDTEPA